LKDGWDFDRWRRTKGPPDAGGRVEGVDKHPSCAGGVWMFPWGSLMGGLP